MDEFCEIDECVKNEPFFTAKWYRFYELDKDAQTIARNDVAVSVFNALPVKIKDFIMNKIFLGMCDYVIIAILKNEKYNKFLFFNNGERVVFPWL